MAARHHGSSVKCQRFLPALHGGSPTLPTAMGGPGALPIPMSQDQKATFLKKAPTIHRNVRRARAVFSLPRQRWGQGQRGVCGVPRGPGHGVQEEDPAAGRRSRRWEAGALGQ